MRILYIVPYSPSLIRVRPYQLIRALANRGHTVEVATLWSSDKEKEGLQQLVFQNPSISVRSHKLPFWRPFWNCLQALPGRVPLQAAFSYEPNLLRDLGRILRERSFEVIHVEHLRGSLFGLELRRMLSPNGSNSGHIKSQTPIVWDCVDCISHLFDQAREKSRSRNGRWMARIELPRTRLYEGWLTTQFDHTLVTSAVDRDAIRQLVDRHQPSDVTPEISVIPNGVDLAYFKPFTGVRDPATLVFTGKMSYHANVTAAVHLIREIMPRIWQQRPDVKLLIAGKDPPRSLRTLAASAGPQPSDHRPNPGGNEPVSITGSVPDLRPYLYRATISLAPVVYGAGIQNKVLEAMACATPVIASSKAVSALSAKSSQDMVVADDPTSFARETLDLLQDSHRRNTIAQAGRAYTERQHDWNRIAALLESAYQQTMQGKILLRSDYSARVNPVHRGASA